MLSGGVAVLWILLCVIYSKKQKNVTKIKAHVSFIIMYYQSWNFILVSPEVLQALHAVLGGVFVRATELLEKGSFTQYQTRNEVRKVYRIRSRLEHYVLFENINFCHCQSFKYQVLHSQNDLTCKHVLAAKLAKIAGLFKVEVISDAQITDILNDQLELEQL